MLQELRLFLEKIVRDDIRYSVNCMEVVSRLDNIVIKSVDKDSWDDTTIYNVKGYIIVQVKTGVFSTRTGKRAFSAIVKGTTGKILVINWEPGQLIKRRI